MTVTCECQQRPVEKALLPRLTPEDNARIRAESERFQQDSAKRGSRDSLYAKAPEEHVATTIKGFNGELLFGLWAGIPWEPEPGQFKWGAPDFQPDIEVRTCYPRSDGQAYIKVTPLDIEVNPDRRFYGVARLSTGFHVIGWVYAREVADFGTVNPNGWGEMYQVQPKDAHRLSCEKGVTPVER